MKRSDVAASLSPQNFGSMWTETRAKCLVCAQMCSFTLLWCFHASLKALYENATMSTYWSKLRLNGMVHHGINEKKDVFPLTFSAVCPTRLFWCELPSVGAISRRAVLSLGYNGTRWHRTFCRSKQQNTLGKTPWWVTDLNLSSFSEELFFLLVWPCRRNSLLIVRRMWTLEL